MRVDLRCPISLKRQETPLRTRKCQHIQTFGLETLVRVASRETISSLRRNHCHAVQCPVCQTEGLLVIAKYVGKLLDTTTSDVIYVTAKGEECFQHAVKKEPYEVITIDDDFNGKVKEKHKYKKAKRLHFYSGRPRMSRRSEATRWPDSKRSDSRWSGPRRSSHQKPRDTRTPTTPRSPWRRYNPNLMVQTANKFGRDYYYEDRSNIYDDY